MEFDSTERVFRLSWQDCADLQLARVVGSVAQADSAWLWRRVNLFRQFAEENTPEEPYTREYMQRNAAMRDVIITAAIESFFSEGGPDQL